jgi:NTE family protein
LSINDLKIRHLQKLNYETVLVMQGGGSLGAYECGVYKTLARHDIKFDIVAGTSIGAINAGIVAGSKSGRPEQDLEDFWLEVADTITPSVMPDSVRAAMSSYYGAFYGNPKLFSPVWFMAQGLDSGNYMLPYLYDLTALKETLQKYVDFTKLKGSLPRLIATCTDIKKGKSVMIDSASMDLDADHLAACASFPFYGIRWTEKDGRYLWDGALLSNTPLREVIELSPKNDKRVYIVNLFPAVQEELPQNLLDSWHRARDIMYTDKTDQNMRMSRIISKYLLLLKEMHDILSNTQLDPQLKERFMKIEREYHRVAQERGAIIDEIVKIERSEDLHFIFEDADFSQATIKKLISQGERDAEKVLAKKKQQSAI